MSANVMLCQGCGQESPSEAKFCIQCGERFALRCPSCGAAVAPGGRFCADCGTALEAPTAPSRPTTPAEAGGERRQLTVLFCDIVNSMGLSHSLDPEELRVILRTYQEACAAAVAKVDGHLAKYMGDGVMAYFGYPQAHDDDARRAVLAALDIVRAVRGISHELRARTNRKIKVRIGIHTGLVVTGELGGGAVREQHGIVGETPNIAARLQAMAEPNGIVICAQTRRLLRDEFDLRSLGQCQIRGLPNPLELFEVSSGSTELVRTAPRYTSVELAGRRKERELLLDRWDLAKGGSGQAVLVSGEAGIGKSTLTSAVRENIEGQSGAVLVLQCSPFFRNTPLYPLVELMTRALALTPGDAPERHIEKIRGSLATIGIAAEPIVGLTAQLLDVPSSDPRHAADPDPARRRRTAMETLAAWLFAGTGQTPKLIVVEDAHWADSSTVELIGLLLDKIATTKVLCVVTFRPEFQPPWPMRSYLAALALPKLATDDVAILANRVAGATLPAAVIERIHAKTDGVPLFVEELTKTIVDSGRLKRSNGAFLLEGSLDSMPIPATLRDSLMARLDRLGSAKMLAQLAAAIGREFDYVLLSSLWSDSAKELDDQLRASVGAEILFQRGMPPALLNIFKHALIQDIAYESLLLSARQDLHGRISDAYLKFADAGRNQPELVARHLTEAGQHALAAEYWMLAGQRACDRWANLDAIGHFDKALDAVARLPEGPDKDEREVAIRLNLGSSIIATEGMAAPRMHEMYSRAAELARRLRLQRELCTALWNEWLYHSQIGQMNAALAFAEEVVQLSDGTNDEDLVLQALHARWTTANLLAKYEQVREDTAQGVGLYDKERHHGLTFAFGGHDAGICARGTGAIALWLTGRPTAALELAADAVRLGGEIAHPFSRGISFWFAMIVEQGCTAYDRILANAELAIDLAQQYKMAQLNWFGSASLGRALIDLGQKNKGFAMLRSAVADMEAAKFNSAYGLYYRFLLAEALAGQQEWAEAQALTVRTLGLLDASGQAFFRPDYLRLRGDCLIGLNGFERSGHDAEQLYREAISLSDFQGSVVHRLRAALALARLLRDCGRTDEGRKIVAESLSLVPEKGVLPELSEALAISM